MLYDRIFDSEKEANDYAKSVEDFDKGKYKAIVSEELGKWIVEVWHAEDY